MCFMTKCPYVPLQEFNVDFPHVMLRYRAVELREGSIPRQQRELVKTDRNGRLAGAVAPLANWATERTNKLTRPLLEKMAGLDRNAALPTFHGRTFVTRSKSAAPPVDHTAPAQSRKAVLYATCFVNYNNPSIGEAAQAVLAKNGVEREPDAAVYGLRQGDIKLSPSHSMRRGSRTSRTGWNECPCPLPPKLNRTAVGSSRPSTPSVE